MKKKARREQIFKLLFRAAFNEPEEMQAQTEMFFESGDQTFSEEDRTIIREKTEKILQRLPEIDEEIAGSMKEWRLDRVGKVELAVLRLAVYEMRYDEEIPEKVAISEAIELATRFGQDGAGTFVNGVLGRLSRGIRRDIEAEEREKEAEKRAKKSGTVVVVTGRGRTASGRTSDAPDRERHT